MSSMASEYGPSRTRHVCHMSVDQHNVGSGGGPRALGWQNLCTVAHGHQFQFGTSPYPLLDHPKLFGPLLEYLLNLRGPYMVYEDFRENDASSARRSAHCDRPWLDPLKQLTSDKVEDRCIGIKTSFRTPVPPLMSWYMRVIIHVRGTDLWLYNWQLIRCREPNQRARCYVKSQKVCACPSTRLWAWIPLGGGIWARAWHHGTGQRR